MMNSLLGTRNTKLGYGNCMENMRLTYIDALQTFYLQTPKQVQELAKLQKQLDKLEDSELHAPVEVGINTVYGLNFKKKWYRVKILSAISADKFGKKKDTVEPPKGVKPADDANAGKTYEGLLIDKGQKVSVKRTELVVLQNFLTRSLANAQGYCLDNVKFPKDISKAHENKINNWLHLTLNNKPITIIPQYPQGTYQKTFVKMYADNVCINDKLVDLGFAQRLFPLTTTYPRMGMAFRDLPYAYQTTDYARSLYNKMAGNLAYNRTPYDYSQTYRNSQVMNGTTKYYSTSSNTGLMNRDFLYLPYDDYHHCDPVSGYEATRSIYGEHCRSREYPYSTTYKKGLLGNAPGSEYREDMAAMQSAILDSMRREMQAMRGQIRAYEHQLHESQEENFIAKVFGVSKLSKMIINKRSSILPRIDTESPLTKVLTMLLEQNSFHTDTDAVITAGKEIRSMTETKNMDKNDSKVAEACKEFETRFEKLNFNETLGLLQTSKADITLVILEMEKARSFTPAMKPSQAQLSVAFSAIAHQYKSWRNSYISSHKNTNTHLEEVATLFDTCSQHFRELSKANTKTSLELPKEKAVGALKACTRENSLSKKENLVYLMMVSCRKEINNRIRKLDHLSSIFQTVKKHGILTVEGLDPKDTSDAPPITLLKFVNRSGQCLQYKKVYHFLQDILKQLTELHGEGKKYIFLNPENVMIKEVAFLVPMETAKPGEPIFPFVFVAPEVKKKIDRLTKQEEENCKGAVSESSAVGSTKTIHARDYQEDKELGTAADIYSFGQLILWLACLDLGGMSFEIWNLMQEKMGVISDLLSTDPIHRPSAVQIKDTLPEIFAKMFGEGIDEEAVPLDDLKIDLKEFVDASSDIEEDSQDEELPDEMNNTGRKSNSNQQHPVNLEDSLSSEC